MRGEGGTGHPKMALTFFVLVFTVDLGPKFLSFVIKIESIDTL